MAYLFASCCNTWGLLRLSCGTLTWEKMGRFSISTKQKRSDLFMAIKFKGPGLIQSAIKSENGLIGWIGLFQRILSLKYKKDINEKQVPYS
jgi:hypothetical protein